MELTKSIKQAICSLFEVHQDECGVQRIVTPLQYAGSGDQIVVRIRPSDDGFQIDENGEACFFASLAEGDVESEAVQRWAEELVLHSPVEMRDDEVLVAKTANERLVPTYVFRVAEAAQQLHALATARQPRRVSDFKNQVAEAVRDAATQAGFTYASDVSLPIAGGFIADHVIEAPTPLIIVAATGIQRLLEAELIHLRYQGEKLPGFVIAAVESQKAVGSKQFERANYYTGKTVSFSRHDFGSLLVSRLND